MELTTRIVLDGLIFPECPRWHGGKLWFSDVQGRKIITIDSAGAAKVVLSPPFEPAGLGCAPKQPICLAGAPDDRVEPLQHTGRGDPD